MVTSGNSFLRIFFTNLQKFFMLFRQKKMQAITSVGFGLYYKIPVNINSVNSGNVCLETKSITSCFNCTPWNITDKEK